MPHIIVRVVAAKNLDLVSDTAFQEPWVVVKLGRLTSTIKASPEPKAIKKNRNPQFNQVLELEFDNVSSARLEVEIRDVDEKGKESLIGALRLRLQNLAQKIPSTASYRLTVPNVSNSKAELELSLEAQDFDTSDAGASASSTSYVPGTKMNGSSGMPPPSASASSSASPSAAPSAAQSFPHAILPSQSPVSQPHQPPSRAAIQQFPAPINYNAKEIKRQHPHIAKGSYGVVYKGTVPDVKEVVVIKDMDFTNQKALDDWRKEIKMMAKTSCEYVVRVLGYATAERTLTIVMELMTKGSLYDLLHSRKEPLSVITRMRMARHCALGLQHLHDLKVMHRDIKSMNILVNDNYSCKLTDFGCAKSLNEQGALLNTANSGTPLWMAPEVKMGHYDYSADVYSLGLVIYELLEKKLPQYDQMRATVVIPREYDSKEIVGPCLHPDPRRRPKASEIVHKLDCVIRNIITSIRKHLKEDELKQFGLASKNDDQLDAEISTLYQILLKKDPKSVDAMVYQAFGSSPEKASANQPDIPLPQPQQQQPFGMGFGAMPVGAVPMGYAPGMPVAGFPMQQYGAQPAFNTPPQFGNPYLPHHHQPHQPHYGQSKPISMLNPYSPNPYAPRPNPYTQHQMLAPPSSSSHVSLSDLGVTESATSPRSPFEDPNQAAYGSPPSRSPSPTTVANEHARIAELAKKSRANELLLDDPYSDAYKRPESPATVAHAASIQGAKFDVMKPEKTGQALLDDLAGLGSVTSASSPNLSNSSSQLSGDAPTLDLSEYGANAAHSERTGSSFDHDSVSIPSSAVSQAGSSAHDLWSPAPSSQLQSPSARSSPSPGSRFSPMSTASDFPIINIENVPRSLSAQPPSSSAATSVGTLIDLISDLPLASAPLSPSSSLTSLSGIPSSSSTNTPSMQPSTSNLLLADFGPSQPSTTSVSNAPKAQTSSPLIDTSDFMVGSSAPVDLPLGDLQLSRQASTPSALLHNDSDPLDFFAGPRTEKMPDLPTQERLRKCFREFAGGSGMVEVGTAGIILENVLASVDSSKLEDSFERNLKRLNVGSSMNEDTCFSVFVQVWNDCM